jgi:putative membrane protein
MSEALVCTSAAITERGRMMTFRAAVMWGVLTLAVPGWPATAFAKEPRPPSRQPANAKMTDESFVKDAAQASIAEVALGKLALQRAQNPYVRQFAQRMVDDHSRANRELTDLATNQGVDVPNEMNAEQRDRNARLATLSGAAFDREYMRAMVKDHARNVVVFRNYAQNGKNEEMKSWAAKTLPMLRRHEQLAGSTAAEIGVS